MEDKKEAKRDGPADAPRFLSCRNVVLIQSFRCHSIHGGNSDRNSEAESGLIPVIGDGEGVTEMRRGQRQRLIPEKLAVSEEGSRVPVHEGYERVNHGVQSFAASGIARGFRGQLEAVSLQQRFVAIQSLHIAYRCVGRWMVKRK